MPEDKRNPALATFQIPYLRYCQVIAISQYLASALQSELRKQLIAIGGILGDAFGVVEAPRVKEKGNEGSQAIHALIDALFKSFFSGAAAAHLGLLLIGQHAIHSLSIFDERIDQSVNLFR